MKALGIGVRVYVSYEPRADEDARWIACNMGTIVAGPFPSDHIFLGDHRRYRLNEVSWRVQLDGFETLADVAQRLLTPIDDDPDAHLTERPEEVSA